MSLRTPAKKTIAALALVLPLTLAACGSGDDEEATSTSSSVKTSATSTSQEPTSEAPTSEEKPEEPTTEEKPAESEDQAAPETLANPFAEGANPLQAAPLSPVEGGQPGDQAVTEQLTQLVGGLYEQQDVRSFTRYVPDHACKALLDSQQEDLRAIDYNQIPNAPMTQFFGEAWNQTGLQSLSDVQVNGDSASANVVVNTPEGQDSSVMRFQKENGQWTFCNA